ncbi:hypothetical protein BDP55DRAFT_633074 [Colletotrichum godetiae]|uniref:Uncharacterized protein n=1 Tax=Colletotrichum godetiae TaxID=1209918 RepID=A0AAJ0AIQ9_9PEZI|nr:uncharacterized protein BDP55DRAFT_633074 [Colletotrichum godetiae]KAK1674640.1 hypothetical protein BDP55DRAFT_633074 [Colletotrichum godetiae]
MPMYCELGRPVRCRRTLHSKHVKIRSNSAPGTTTFVPSWKYEPFPGEIVHFNGTVEGVLAHLKQINPDYRLPDDAADVAGPRGRGSIRSVLSSLQRRSEQTIVETTVTKDIVTRNDTKPSNVASIVAAGVTLLLRVPGQPQAGPGPESCGRVSCSYGTAIWFCNNVSLSGAFLQAFLISDPIEYW